MVTFSGKEFSRNITVSIHLVLIMRLNLNVFNQMDI